MANTILFSLERLDWFASGWRTTEDKRDGGIASSFEEDEMEGMTETFHAPRGADALFRVGRTLYASGPVEFCISLEVEETFDEERR